MAQASVVRPSVNSGFPETAAWTQANFYGKLHTHHITIYCRQNFFSFSLTLDPSYESKKSFLSDLSQTL